MPTILQITFIVGLFLIIVGVFGGGIEVKEIRIPSLAPMSRIFSFVIGIAFVVLCIAFPGMFPPEGTMSLGKFKNDKVNNTEIADADSNIILDKVHHSDDLRMTFAFPFKMFILDTTQRTNGVLILMDADRHVRVKITRRPLPDVKDVKLSREQEREALEKVGYTFTYVAPEKEENWKNWYVLSGLTNDTVFYFKRWYLADGIGSIEFTFPIELRPVYDRLIPAMVQQLSFEGGPYVAAPTPSPAVQSNSTVRTKKEAEAPRNMRSR